MDESSEPQIRNYGATTETDGDDTQSYDTLEDPPWQDDEPADNYYFKLYQTLKNSLRIIANVENLWDSDTDVSPDQRRRNHLVVLFWFFLLALSYAGERSTFKLLVDRTAPFRLLTVEAVTAAHAVLLGLLVLAGSFWKTPTVQLGIPLVHVGFMALLDTLCILLVFVSGYRVPPTLTVILVQFTLPLTAFLTQFINPARQIDIVVGSSDSTVPGYGNLAKEHVWGSLILSLAVMVALLPSFVTLIDPNEFLYADSVPTRTAINSLLYVSSCIPAAIVTVRLNRVSGGHFFSLLTFAAALQRTCLLAVQTTGP